jgi:hypothetical protein
MANKVSSHLYDLIYSLSSSERRYFKLYVANHIGKQNDLSLKLFDLIARNEGTPIEKIEKRIKFTNHPSRLKNYLYDLILKSLEAYHSKNSISIKIRKLINQIENLYNKALYEQCIVLAKKTLKEAEKIDNQNFKIDILDWHMNALRQLEFKNSDRLDAELWVKQQDSINKIRLEKEFKKLDKAIFNLLKQLGTIRTKENENKLKELFDNPLLSDYSLATSYPAKSNFNSIHANYYQYFGDIKTMGYYLKQNLQLYEDFPATKELEQFNYITCLNNYSLSCAGLGDFEKADYYFSKMENIIPNTEQIEVKIFEYLSANRLDLYLRSPDLQKGLSLVPKIVADIEKYGKKVSTLFKTVMYSNLCYLFFATEQNKLALKYNNLIIDEESTIFRTDIFRFARIMNLLIHYEMGDKLSINYFYDATERYLNKNNKIYVFETWFMQFFKALLKLDNTDNKLFFKAKEQELLAILLDKNERIVISHFNILAWLRTKIDNISFENAIKDYSLIPYEEYMKNRLG